MEKKEPLTIDYCYFDGKAHRYQLTVTQGTLITDFLSRTLEQLQATKVIFF
jgi:hypothetical protein